MTIKDYAGVTVFCEQREQVISKVSFELIGKFVQESLLFGQPVKRKLSICPICFNRSTSSQIDRAFNAVLEFSR